METFLLFPILLLFSWMPSIQGLQCYECASYECLIAIAPPEIISCDILGDSYGGPMCAKRVIYGYTLRTCNYADLCSINDIECCSTDLCNSLNIAGDNATSSETGVEPGNSSEGLECHLCSDGLKAGYCDDYGTTTVCPEDPTGYLGNPRCASTIQDNHEILGCTYEWGCTWPVSCCDSHLCNTPGSSGGSNSGGSGSTGGIGLRCYECLDLDGSGVCERNSFIQTCFEDPIGILGYPVCSRFELGAILILECSFSELCFDGVDCCTGNLCNTGASMVTSQLLMGIMITTTSILISLPW